MLLNITNNSWFCILYLFVLSAVEVKACQFNLLWRSLYACPICSQAEFEETHTDCLNGKKNVTYHYVGDCRNSTSKQKEHTQYFVPCKVWPAVDISTGLIHSIFNFYAELQKFVDLPPNLKFMVSPFLNLTQCKITQKTAVQCSAYHSSVQRNY